MNYSNKSLEHEDIIAALYFYGSIVAIVLFSIGFAANFFLLYIFIFQKYFHKSTYILMLVSSISDTLSIGCSLYAYVLATLNLVDFHSGTIACKIVMYTVATSYTISIFNLCLIAIDRYFTVVYFHMRWYRNYKVKILVCLEVMIWLTAASINSPFISYIGVHPEVTVLCDILNITTPICVHLFLLVLVCYVIPAIIIAFFYWRIILHQKSYIRPGQISNQQRLQQQAQKRKFIQMLATIAGSFILASWPMFATLTGIAITRKSFIQLQRENLVIYFLSFFSLLATTSITVINPLLYIKFDRNIRKQLLKAIQLLHITGANSDQQSTMVTLVSNRTPNQS